MLSIASCAIKPVDGPVSAKTDLSNFRVEASTQPTLEGTLFLKDDTGHCHLLVHVEQFLNSKTFRSHNPELIPIFEKAKIMMQKGQTGKVLVSNK